MKPLIAAILVVSCSAGAFAQAPSASYTSAVTSSWNRVKRLVTASAEAVPEASYTFKPSPDVRTFGELIGHLADDHYVFCSGVKGEKNPKQGASLEKLATKAELIKALNESIAYCDAVYAAAKDDAKLLEPAAPNRRDTPFGGLLMNVTHDSEHYGNLVTYMRMKGIVPPSSQPTR
jgi:uncharacterized damage-inducible protein DinB